MSGTSQKKTKRHIPRKKDCEFVSDDSVDNNATQLMSPDGEKRKKTVPSTPVKPARSKGNGNVQRQRLEVENTLIVEDGTQCNRSNRCNIVKEESTLTGLGEFPMTGTSGTYSRSKQTKKRTKRQTDGHNYAEGVSSSKLRKQSTLQNESDDIESVFFAQSIQESVSGVDLHEEVQKPQVQNPVNFDTVNADELVSNNTGAVKENVQIDDKEDGQDRPEDDTVNEFLDMILGNNKAMKRRAPPSKRTAKTALLKISEIQTQ